MGFVFEQPLAWHALWLVAACAALVWWAATKRTAALRRWADAPLLARLAPGVRTAGTVARGILVVLATAVLVVALADPRLGAEPVEVQRRGIDVFFVIDVSRSMLAEDARPNRLDRARQFAADMVDRMAGDRAGLIAFAGTPTLASPLTLNYGAFKQSINELTTQDSRRGGSLLGDAIRLASESFTDEIKGGKAIVVLTDGEDMESFPVEAAAKAFSERGIRTYAVGIGDAANGARIPIRDRSGTRFLEYEGAEVVTRLDPKLLTEMSIAGGGAYIPAGTANVDMGEVYEEVVAATGRREFETVAARRTLPQFQWFAGLALVLLVVEGCLGLRGRRIGDRDTVRAQGGAQ
jgi:Ca-activated chloride channel family protein